MKDMKREEGSNQTASKKKKSKAGKFSSSRKKSSRLDDYKYDKKPGVVMSHKTEGHPPNRADAEMARLMQGNVFRSAEKSIKKTNSNARRYS